ANDEGFGRTGPTELRQWNDTAPEIAIGMEGSPGHQAAGLVPERYPKRPLLRGNYPWIPTRGGFDIMTAELGGVWDSMLGEGRRWWITGTSDSHRHWSEGGNDFWPGEYSKTYVYANKTYSDILQSLREGRVFVTTGDLISELEFTVGADGAEASIGETLEIVGASNVQVTIRLRDPSAANGNGEDPSVARVDLITGNVDPALIEAAGDINPSTSVVHRFTAADWVRDGDYLFMTHEFSEVRDAMYVRVRGTSTAELEPEPDVIDEDPWQDLWFYSNPVFVLVASE
ncbi:MAG: phosphoesterase, partial [Gammaproteobacteria bacterium]